MSSNDLLVPLLCARHNSEILKSAVKTINSFLKDGTHKLYFWDKDKNVFVPKGEINISCVDIMEDENG